MNSSKIVVGIDPGIKGALTRITETTQEAIPMPTIGKEIDAHSVAVWLREQRPDLVIIEKVGAMPNQGVTSMFNFGRGTGKLLGVLEALAIPYHEVRPQAWKKAILHGTAHDKQAAIDYVSARYPDLPLILPRCRKPSDGIADATCMAVYGVLTYAKG